MDKANVIDKVVTLKPQAYAKRVGIGQNKIYDIINIEGFPVLRIGRTSRILVEAADKWLEKYAISGQKI